MHRGCSSCRLSNEVRNRSTYTAVECERYWLYDEGLIQEIRLDTGEVILSRPMTDGERQRLLPLVEEGD